ncbi:DHA2 family efflux MFS transporter permease subunit [Neisseria sp. Ec49-e6-T10]
MALEPLSGKQLALGTLALSLATFMNVLDSSIANVSLPAIAGDLGVSPNQGTWVITSFAVANAISVPLTGFLTVRIGAVRLFVASILLFVLASWLCGFAHSLEALIGFRVMQGFVAGPMIPLSQSLLLSSYPKAKAGSAMAIWSMTTSVAPIAGPLLGGWITDHVSWSWIFYINIPFGLAAALITWLIYKDRETPTKKLPIDSIGLALLVIWVSALQIMLDTGKENDWFASTEVIVLGLIALVGFVVFVIWEWAEEHPVIDIKLFKGINFSCGTILISVGYGLFFGNVVLLPLWLQQYMGYTATNAGWALAPVGLLSIVMMPFVGKNISRFDVRWFATISFIVFVLVFWMRSHFNTDADLTTIMVPALIQGVAMAFFFVPLITMGMAGLPPEKIPSASGLMNFVRITAGAMGTSLSTTLWEDRAKLHHAQLTEHIVQGDPVSGATIEQLKALGMTTDQALAYINRLIDQQAFTLAANDIFYGSAVLFLGMIVLVWLVKPTKDGAADSSASSHAAH